MKRYTDLKQNQSQTEYVKGACIFYIVKSQKKKDN